MSNLRMLDSTNKINKLIDYAIELKLKGIAITDHESLSNHIKGLQYIKELKAKAKQTLKENPEDERAQIINNFVLGLGNEIYLCRDGLNKDNYVKGEDKFFHFILIAKDKIGHHQLRLLSSRAWDRTFRQFIERVPTYYSDLEEIVGSNSGHLIATTACLGGQFAQSLMNGKLPQAINFLKWCNNIFGQGNFFIEIQPGISEEQINFNQSAIHIADSLGIPVTIATDAHYLRAEDRKIHESFLNSGEGDRETGDFYASTYLMSVDEIREKLSYLPEEVVETALNNSLKLADGIEEYDLAHKQIIPRIPLDFNRFKNLVFNYENYPYIKKFFNSKYEEDVFFISSVFKRGLEYNLLDKTHMDRIEQECEEIWIVSEKIEERLSAYFITIQKIIELIWENDSLVGPWRGSVGSMVTAYLMDITQADPLSMPAELPYWRFVSRGRAELADIDIDSQASKREKCIEGIKKYFESIGGELTAVATFGTETSKAALQTACRGLGYEPELGSYLSSLVPSDRGFVRELDWCYYGNEEKGYTPIAQFVKEMDAHPDIWEVAHFIEGLISHRGVHAAGIILTNGKFTDLGATMRSPKGVVCSQWELHDEEYAGHIKFDMLTVDALDRIRTTMELLINDGRIIRQNSLKETYMKYLAPQKINYDNQEMWRLVGENKIISLFQFDTPVGLQTAKEIQPTNLLELAQANSLMRLMPEGKSETPVQEFVKYKKFPELLKGEIESLNATKEEKEILYNYMKKYGGVLDSQESVMQATMLPFTQYTVDESNVLRKTIAKKQLKKVSEQREKYFAKGREIGTSEDILHYLWDVNFTRQLGYSFSVIHTIGYSIVAVQELNLAFFYPRVYWNAANLIVDSSGIEDEFETENEPIVAEEEATVDNEDDDEDEDEEVKDKVEKKKKTKTVNYGKISSAIGNMKSAGIEVTPPDINTSSFTFKPDVENNRIIYGIKGITKVNDTLAHEIICQRPFNSLNDFLNKVKATKLQVINLIKSGAFDNIENKNREDILKEYIISIAGLKKKLTLQNMPTLIKMNIIPPEYDIEKRIYNFNKFLKKNCKQGEYYVIDDYCQDFYNRLFDTDLLIFDEEGMCKIRQKVWDKMYKTAIEKIRPFINDPNTLTALNSQIIQELWNKYCDGFIPKWEMDSIGFYNTAHELDGLDLSRYEPINFSKEPEDPVPITIKNFNGKQIPIYELKCIAGTVLEKNKLKNIVTLLTQYGVVKVKVYKSQFSKYDKQIFIKDPETGKKKVIEKSWFARGNKLIIQGIRRGANFIPKAYKTSEIKPITLIDEVDYQTGSIKIKTEREE